MLSERLAAWMDARASGSRRVWRCTGCQCCPDPKDLDYYWGSTNWDHEQTQCLECRGAGRLGTMTICVVPKLGARRDRDVEKWMVPPQVHADLGPTAYLTDGERVWMWVALELGPLTRNLTEHVRGRMVKWVKAG